MSVEKLRAWVEEQRQYFTDHCEQLPDGNYTITSKQAEHLLDKHGRGITIILTLADVLEASQAYEVQAQRIFNGESLRGELILAFHTLKDKVAAACKTIKKVAR